MNNEPIKVGTLVSYDYHYLKNALPIIYPYADSITLALDKNRQTWSGETFDIPTSFFDWIKEFDIDKKIHIYEDVFYVSELSSIECDTRERNLLAKAMGEGGWHLQIDSDEYFIDFAGFVNYLHQLDFTKRTSVYAEWITLYKKDETGFFYIDGSEVFPVATNQPDYIMARKLSYSDAVYTNFKVLHQSWARGDDEILFKLKNWGHKTDFNVDSYYSFWKSIDRYTYKYIRSFHPLDGWLWPSLEYVESLEIDMLIDEVKLKLEQKTDAKHQEKKISIKDWIPVALYKIKDKLT